MQHSTKKLGDTRHPIRVNNRPLDSELETVMDRLHLRILADDLEQHPDVWADLAQRQLARQREIPAVHPDAAPSAAPGDAVRFGIACIIILGMTYVLMWLVGGVQ